MKVSAQRVAVIGAGIGGLVAALELAAHGLEVIVVEQAAAPGGKMREDQIGDTRLDAGPTVFTMRWVFDEIFNAVGASLPERVHLKPVDVLARHAWSGDERLDLFADLERSVDAIGALAGAAEARRYRRFTERARRTYETLEWSFIRAARPNPVSLVQRVFRPCGARWETTSTIRDCGSCSGVTPHIADRRPFWRRPPSCWSRMSSATACGWWKAACINWPRRWPISARNIARPFDTRPKPPRS